MKAAERVLVTGAGGFIGHHLVRFLKKKGCWVRGADIAHPEFSPADEADEFLLLDLRESGNSITAVRGVDKVYTLAANMGGIGFITEVSADVMRDNILINTHMAEAARREGVGRIFFSSSACIYPAFRQEESMSAALKESDAYPADPDSAYGWEKLFSERLYESYVRDHGLEVRIGRYHNIFGPEGAFTGGREKAPAAICRKIVEAEDGGTIEVWGDGEQTRSFCYIDDCLEKTYRLMESDYQSPLNIGSDRMVTVNELVDMAAGIASKTITKTYLRDKPQGVRGRNSDNTVADSVLGYKNSVSLEEGLRRTYEWINAHGA